MYDLKHFSKIKIAEEQNERIYIPNFKFVVKRFRWKKHEKRKSGKNSHIFKKFISNNKNVDICFKLTKKCLKYFVYIHSEK